MRLGLDWLAEWIDLPDDDALVDRLDMGGFEDTRVESPGPDLGAVRVGRVLERAAHPNADRLSLCRVELGEGEPLEIVCGAPNVAAGQRVAVATAGSRLPDGTKLKKTKIRGVVSHGMICSARELGLGDEHEGILVLPETAPVGAALPDVLPLGGRALEVGITPNRGDTASLLGVAREVRAHFGGEIRVPETAPAEDGAAAADSVQVAIETPEACHHYAARVVRGLRVGPSPDWLRRKLEASGLRSINCVVDVTNAVLLEFGQPLHAFDLTGLREARVAVRRARRGEKLVTLDGETRELDTGDLVIADGERAIALAGVMGGADTEVTDSTRDVLIESAHFAPASVRLTARRHGLHTDASYRFERGVDREGVRRAADRCARLLAEVAGGEVAHGAVEARGEPAPRTEEIRLEARRANRLLGTSLAAPEMAELLVRVGVECREPEPGVLVGRVPSHRNDLHVHQDLTEEVARIYGYDRIPTTEPTGVLRPAQVPGARRRADAAQDLLAACGALETVSFPFVPESDADDLRLSGDHPLRPTLALVNPIREEEPRLRSTLLPTLLRQVRQNLARQCERVRLFEVCRVFRPRGEDELPAEPLQATCVLAEGGREGLWEGPAPPLFFQARGVAEKLLDGLGYVAALRPEGVPPYLHPGAAVTCSVGGRVIGAVGELHPEVAASFGLEVPCAVVEIDLDALGASAPRPPRFRAVSRFPLIRRDLALLLPEGVAAETLRAAAREAAGSDCTSVEIFDRYEGRGVPEGRVSLAFRLVFQRSDRTLKDSEVAPAIDRVVETLARRFGAELRQGSAGGKR